MKRLVLLFPRLPGLLLAGLLAVLRSGSAEAQSTAAPDADPMPALRQALTRATTDTTRARLYFALSEVVNGADSTRFFARQALVLLERGGPAASPAERRRLLRLKASALNNLGVGTTEPAESLLYYRRAWQLRHQLDDWAGQAETSINLGECVAHTGDIRAAIAWFERGLRVAETHPEARDQVSALLGHLANVYDQQGDAANALRYYQRALRLDEQRGNKRAMADRLRLISGMLIQLARYAEAETSAQRGLELAKQTDYQEVVGGCENQLGLIRGRQGRLPEARAYLLRAREHFQQLNDKLNQGLTWLYLGQIEAKNQQPDAALRAALRADALFRDAEQLTMQQDVAKLLSDLYHRRGDDGLALASYQRYIQLRDSLQNNRNQAAALQQRLGYEFERRTATLRAAQDKRQAVAQGEIRREKVLRYATTGGAVGLLLLLFILWQRFRFMRRANAIIEAARARAEREQQRSDALLLNILPAETADELKRTGHAQARHHAQVTVLFADVIDFTQLAEALPARALVEVLDTYFGRFDDLCDQFKLEKIKTIGDAYLLTGGLHGTTLNAPATVVRCALAMQVAVEELRQRRETDGQTALLWRIGIHTGPVVAGVVGRRKFAYDIWGDTVNTAARMEQTSRARHVNISGATHALVHDQFVCTPRGALPVRHKADIEMYFVERVVEEVMAD